MKLRPDKLDAHLEKGLAPVYLVSGDEPYQALWAADAVRAAARRHGYNERQVLSADASFDWAELEAAASNLSLFATRRLIDLRLPSGKPGTRGAKALGAYAARPPPDTALLMQCPRLERASLSSAWVKALEAAGVLIQVWPLERRETEAWIAQRLRAAGVEADAQARRVLAEYAEGNLLAGAQEVDKLALLYAGERGPLDARTVLTAVMDSARFSVFDLADAALAGESARAVRVLRGLEREDTAPPLVLWSLTREVRQLTGLALEIAAGAAPERALQAVQGARRPRVQAALKRYSPARWQSLLRECARVDRVIKGQQAGRVWDELLQLVLALSARPLFADT